MPGFDGTGPMGQGPFTGGGLGYCIAKLVAPDGPGSEDKFFDTGNEVFEMARGDGTGPAGMGPMTGRAAGFCAGYSVPGYMNATGQGFGGGGFGRGRGGGGMGRRNRFYATGLTGSQLAGMAGQVNSAQTATKQQQVDALKAQAEYLQESLKDISKRIEELQAQN